MDNASSIDATPNALSRKAIFITGAAAGIGKATAELFCRRGWFVGLAGRDAATLAAVREQLGEDNCSIHRLDVTDYDAVKSAW